MLTNEKQPIEIHDPNVLNFDEYWALKQVGVFSSYYKVELLDGELWGVRQWTRNEDEIDEQHRLQLQRVDSHWIVAEI